MHYAACGGYEDVVLVLIEAGANVEEHNENGHTPLMEAASAGHVGVAKILLEFGAGIIGEHPAAGRPVARARGTEGHVVGMTRGQNDGRVVGAGLPDHGRQGDRIEAAQGFLHDGAQQGE